MGFHGYGAVGSAGGSWKNCPQCGKLFFVTDPDAWAYKRSVSRDGNGRQEHFCKWSCLLAFDREYEKQKQEKRKAAGWKKKGAE